MSDAYRAFLEAKCRLSADHGFEVEDSEIHPLLKPHQRACVRWAVRGGRRALFESFGLGKSVQQIEILRLVLAKLGHGRALIVAPLGVRQEFKRDAAMLGLSIEFVRRSAEVDGDGLYITNYESVRDGRLDVNLFEAVSLDEASCLRGFGGTKTFREFMKAFEGCGPRYKFVATATPSPNQYIELLAYSAFLEVMDVGQAKTRFFKRDSEKADNLSLHPHKEEEFWLWVNSWAVFLQRPSDLGFSDEGYALPPLDVRWHEIPTDHSAAGAERGGQGRMFKNAAIALPEAAREKRDSLPLRISKLLDLRAEDPGAHRLIWHDLEAEREAIERAIPGVRSVYGTMDLEEREARIIGFSDGEFQELAAKPVLAGSGCNFQRHCAWAIFLGIGFKFNDFIQAVHRIQRFLQTRTVRIDLLYTEAEREIRRTLEAKWKRHEHMVSKMSEIIRRYRLNQSLMEEQLTRTINVERVVVEGEGFKLVNNDCVLEMVHIEDDSLDLVVTSIPFSTQYEYTPSYLDFGHTDDDAHFWGQMDFLIPELLRATKPGRVAAIHVKDRITPGGINGFGFQTLSPFSDDCIRAFRKHGWAFLGRKTIVTDVVRENNQTYRLGWTEQCKDGSRMGCGVPEYLLLFRKAPTDRSNGYADEPVVKPKMLWRGERWENEGGYSRARWQLDAHGFERSSGNRPLLPEDLVGVAPDVVYKLWRRFGLENVYDFEHHVACAETLEANGSLPPTFMLLPPASWHPDVWTDVTRMLTLNGMQHAKGREMHLCLARGSLVLTRGGYKPIQEIVPGDQVLTHMGRWRAVLAVQNTGVRPVVHLRAQGVSSLMLTPGHRLWIRKVRDLPGSRAHARAEAKAVAPGWVPAGEAAKSYVNLKLPPVETPTTTDAVHWWAVGRWLADGHIDKRKGAIISCGWHKLSETVASLGRFAGNPPRDTRTGAQILLRDPGKFLRRTLRSCGSGASGKHLPPEAFTLPVEQAGALLDGYLSGDGYYVKERNRWTASSVSRELLLGVAALAQRVHGSLASIYPGRPGGTATIEGRVVTTKQDWILSFDVPNVGPQRIRPFILDDGGWAKVRAVDPVGEMETWNLRVEEDESYLAEGCIVKNCPLQFDIVDRAIAQFSQPGELVFDPFGGLMTVPYRAIKAGRRALAVELNAGYFRDGVSYVDAAARERAMPTLFDLLDAERQDEAA